MKPLQKDYIARVYAGVLGKTIGVRHGSNDEGWSYEKIKETVGEIKDYLFTFKNFASDDDTNGTFLLPLALTVSIGVGYCFLVCILAFAASLEELVIHLCGHGYQADRKSIFCKRNMWSGL